MTARGAGSAPGKKTFEEWVAEKDDEQAAMAAELAARKRAASASSAHRESQRSAAFDSWVRHKDLAERATVLLHRLSVRRAQQEDQWLAVCRALAAVQVALAVGDRKAATASPTVTPSPPPPTWTPASLTEAALDAHGARAGTHTSARLLEGAFMAWSRRHHAFEEVVIPPAITAKMTRGAVAMLDARPDGSHLLSGLTFVPAAKPSGTSGKKGPATLSSDDQIRNGIFNAKCKAAWRAAVAEAAAAALSPSTASTPTPAAGGGGGVPANWKVLTSRGIAALSNMASADARTAVDAAKSHASSKREEGVDSHRRWLRMKDVTRIKLPPPTTPFREEPQPRMDFGVGHGSGRAAIVRPPLRVTSADVMRRCGMQLRYAHAVGRSGTAMADLMASRRRLLAEGWVYRDNFVDPDVGRLDEEAESKWEEERRRNRALRERAASADKRRERDEAAFASWSGEKEAVAAVMECLALLPVAVVDDEVDGAWTEEEEGKGAEDGDEVASRGGGTPGGAGKRRPSVTAASTASAGLGRVIIDLGAEEAARRAGEVHGGGGGGSATSMASSRHARAGAAGGTLGRPPTATERELWRTVGCACRAVDKALLGAWMEWSSPLFSRPQCMTAWQSFRPGQLPASRAGGTPPSNRAAGEWDDDDRKAAVKVLWKLSASHRAAAAMDRVAAAEAAPCTPVLQRVAAAEMLPAFIHGYVECVAAAARAEGASPGHPVLCLGGTGVGGELVLRWWVGRDGDDGQQPPYAVVLETCGVAGSASQREGVWSRVLIDPPQPAPILTSPPASTTIPLCRTRQGLGPHVLPPHAQPGVDGFLAAAADPTALRGCVRLTGLLPNTTYSYRVRAFNRVGASPYAFGVFTTAPPPPPAPCVAHAKVVPLSLLHPGDAAELGGAGATPPPVTPDGVTLCWDRRVARRVALLRLLWVCARAVRMTAAADGSTPPTVTAAPLPPWDVGGADARPQVDVDAPVRARDPGAASGVGLHAAMDRTVLLRCLAKNHAALACSTAMLASPAYWPIRPDAAGAIESALRAQARRHAGATGVGEVGAEEEEEEEEAADETGGLGLKARQPLCVYDVIRSHWDGETLTVGDVLRLCASDTMHPALSADVALVTLPAATVGDAPQGGTSSALATPSNATVSGHGRRRSSTCGASAVVAGASGDASPHPPASGDGASTRYALLQCVHDSSDGGQDWVEVFVGMRCVKRVTRLSPAGATFAFRAQAINADGVASLLGPPVVVSTALPAPEGLALKHAPTATHITLTCKPVAMSGTSGGTVPTTEASAHGVTKAAAPIAPSVADALLAGLVRRGWEQGGGVAAPTTPGSRRPSTASAALIASHAGPGTAHRRPSSASGADSGANGISVDVRRYWDQYDADGRGSIDTMQLRGLLSDLGALVQEHTALLASAGEVVGVTTHPATTPTRWTALDMQWAAALLVLDPRGDDRVTWARFHDWWAGVDAARAEVKARIATATAQPHAATPVASSSILSGGGGGWGCHTSATGGEGGGWGAASPQAMLGLTRDVAVSAVGLYVLEGRRRLTADDAVVGARVPALTATAAPVVTTPTMARTRRTPWFTVCANPKPSAFHVTDLLPNQSYQFRVTLVGRHASSSASPTLSVTTPPLAPFAPVTIHTASRSVAVRWYPGECGAAKFQLQYAPVEPLMPIAQGVLTQARAAGLGSTSGRAPASSRPDEATSMLEALIAARATLHRGRNVTEKAARALMTMGRPATAGESGGAGGGDAAAGRETWRWVEGLPSMSWQTGYVGTHTHACLSGLECNMVYRLRVVAYNEDGDASLPSPECQVITLDHTLVTPFTPGNAARQFVLEVPRLPTPATHPPAPPGMELDVVVGDVLCWTEDVFVEGRGDAPWNGSGAPPPVHEVPPDHAAAKYVCSRTLAAVVLSDTATRMGKATVAGGVSDGHAGRREVTVQVEWCVVGATDLPATHPWRQALQVAPGAIIKRCAAMGVHGSLAMCDVFRMPWEDEAGRWSVAEEVAASSAGWDVPPPPT